MVRLEDGDSVGDYAEGVKSENGDVDGDSGADGDVVDGF